MKVSAKQRLNDFVSRFPAMESQTASLHRLTEIIIATFRSGGKLLICGNGGSAADGDHIVGELVKGFCYPRKLPESEREKLRESGIEDWEHLANTLQSGLPAISLAGHPALSTAILNDNDPYMTFAQQVYVMGRPGDVVLGISTSGNSRNVINALKVAKAFDMRTMGLCGTNASQMDDVCDTVIHVPENEAYKIQEYHLPLYHALCLALECDFFDHSHPIKIIQEVQCLTDRKAAAAWQAPDGQAVATPGRSAQCDASAVGDGQDVENARGLGSER